MQETGAEKQSVSGALRKPKRMFNVNWAAKYGEIPPSIYISTIAAFSKKRKKEAVEGVRVTLDFSLPSQERIALVYGQSNSTSRINRTRRTDARVSNI